MAEKKTPKRASGSGHDGTGPGRLEEALRESEERYRSLIEKMEDIPYRVDIEGRLTFIGPQVERYGIRSKDLVGKNLTELEVLSQEDREKIVRTFRDAVDQGIERRTTICVPTPKLGIRYFEENGTVFRDEKGDVAGLTGILRDITERKLSEEKYRWLIETQAEGIGIVDLNEVFTFSNPAGDEIFGVPSGSLVGRCLSEFTDPEAMSVVKEQTRRRRKGEKATYDIDITCPNGDRKSIAIAPTPRLEKDGRFSGTLAIFRDVTDAKRMERELRRSEERYRNVMEYSHDAICLVDSMGRIVETNAAGGKLGGLSPEKMKGMPFQEILSGETAKNFMKTFGALLETGRLEGEFTMEMRDGNVRILDVSAVAMEKDLFLVRTRDLTKEKQLAAQAREAEIRLIHADRLSTLGTMAAGIAHEINQPLNAIQVITSGMLYGHEQNWSLSEDQLLDNLKMISRQVRRMSDLVKNIRKFSRRDRTRKLEQIDLNSVIVATYEMLGTQLKDAGIDVRIQIDESIPRILGVFNPIQQILVNLITNAREAIEGNRAGQPKILTLSSSEAKGSVEVHVTDSGSGLSDTVMKNLFVPFFTTKGPQEGTGLGLAISTSIARDFGGTLEGRNNESYGAAFILRFPAIRKDNHEDSAD
jgi:PAS domain S-box-containing protein